MKNTGYFHIATYLFQNKTLAVATQRQTKRFLW